MSENQFHKQFSEGDELPVNIPPADNAWSDMRGRLDDGMPEVRAAAPLRNLWKWFAGLLLLLFISWVVYTQLPSTEEKGITSSVNTKEKATAAGKQNNTTDKPVAETLSESNIPEVKNEKEESTTTNTTVTNKKESIVKTGGGNNEKDIVSTGRNRNKSSKKVNDIPVTVKQGKKKNIENKDEKTAIDLLYSPVSADNSEAAIVNHKLPSSLPEDSTAGSPIQKEQVGPAKAKIKIQGGLQWNFQSPSNGNGTYFYNEKGKPEPLRAFYPGAWLSFQHNKSLYTIEVSPFFTTALPAKSYRSETMSYRIGDTNFTRTESSTLHKLFGVSAAIGYSHNVTGNWWAGGSLRSNWWQKGAASSTIDLVKRSDSGSFTDIKSTSTRTFLLSDSSWPAFSKFQFVMNADIFYRRDLWQAGLQVGLPINALTKRNGPRNPLYAALIVRLNIPSGNGKK